MIIRSLKLQDVRSHHKSEVQFTEGFNCVTGGVGVGKTTILYAIHFALFGEPLFRSYDYLLREGTATGKVLLRFEHNGHEYTITRQLHREKDRIVQDMDELYLYQDGKVAAWGKVGAVQEQLKSLTGLDRRIFEEFIWIQQEKLKVLLDLRPAERQRLLDEVFGLSDFQRGWEKLQQFQRDYQSTITTLEKDPDLLNLPQLASDLEETEKTVLNETVELENAKLDLEAAEKKLEQLTERLQTAEDQRKKINALEIELASLQTRRIELTKQAEQLERQRSQAEAELEKGTKILQELNHSVEHVLRTVAATGYPSVKDAANLQTVLSQLDSNVTALHARLATLKAQSSNSSDSLQVLSEQSVCPTCRQPLDEEYRRTFTQQMTTELKQCEDEIHKATAEIARIQQTRTAISNAVKQLETATLEKGNIKKRIAELKQRTTDIAEELEENHRILDDAVSPRIAEIEAPVSQFDVEELEESRKLKEEAVKAFERLKVTVTAKTELLQRVQTTKDHLQKRISNAQQKVDEKRSAEKILSIVSLFRTAYKAVIPSVRRGYTDSLRLYLQSALDSLTALSGRSYYIETDEEYTPLIREESGETREVNQLSGGERTWIALAYRIGLGQLVTEARTGQSPEILIMDEPTEALGSEDSSIEALASAVSSMKAARQILVVTHSEALADKASYKIALSKEHGGTVIHSADFEVG
ncbi:MAG: AAA family ATPase [Candidatus Bathyarchaeia archaeon]